LFVSEYGGTNVWSFVLNEDGTLWAGERYMELRAPTNQSDSDGDGMTVDQEGRPFVTSHVGIQMFDATGRLGGVITKPSVKACVSVTFAARTVPGSMPARATRSFVKPSRSGGANFACADGGVRFLKFGRSVNPMNWWCVSEADRMKYALPLITLQP
jgi:hypothetical protein